MLPGKISSHVVSGRLVHFYHEVIPDEPYNICSSHLGDIGRIALSVRLWLLAHPESLDETL